MSLNINSKRETSAGQSGSVILETKSLSAVQKFELDWFHFSQELSQEANLSKLRDLAVTGELKVSKFRSICWSTLLGLLDGNSNDWPNQRIEQRLEYARLKRIYSVNPHTLENDKDDPLSQCKQSVWYQHFCDQELVGVINQDVVRTFPGVDFFRRPNVQNIMTNILFCYARKHPKMCYRQGMHEILAPVIFVIHSDHQVITHIKEINPSIDSVLQKLLNPEYLEEDSFAMFSRIMVSIESYYNITDLVPSSTGYFPLSPGSPSSPNEPNRQSEIEVVNKLNKIRDKILAKEDLHLHNHLLKLDISLPIFGIRWLRLLFGREFPLQDLLVLWDAIFAEGTDFELADFIVVAMLVRIRDRLLVSDYTTCLTHLMRYPNNVDINLVIRHALHLKCPQKFDRPPNAFVHIPTENKSATLPRQSQTKPKPQPQQRSTPPEISKTERRRTQSDELLVNGLQVATVLKTMKLANKALRQEDEMPGVVEGYMENSPDVLRLELHNAHTIMTISRIKLIKYLSVLRKYIPGHAMDELHQTLDGIEELCALLKTKQSTPYIMPAQVDLALEANESGQNRQHRDSITPVPVARMPPHKVTDAEAKRQFVLSLKNESLSMTQPVQGKVIDVLMNARGTRYEIPDDKMTRTAAKILGNRTELEMHDLHNFEELVAHEAAACDVPIVDPPGERSSPNNN